MPGRGVEPGPPFVCARFQNGIDFFNYGKKFVGISFLNGARGDFFPIRFSVFTGRRSSELKR